MSISGTFEITVTVDTFKNVDLFHQGMYYIKMAIHTEDDESNYATPIMTAIGTSEREMTGLPQHKPAHILDHENTFCTRTFLIRYCEEEITLGDVGHFRLNMDASKLTNQGPSFGAVIIELDLMYASHKKVVADGQPKDVDFTSVSKHRFRCFKAAQGVYQYCPVTFDEWHFCFVDVAIHMVLLNCEFKKPTKHALDAAKAAAEEEANGGVAAWFRSVLVKPAPRPPAATLTELIQRNMEGAQGAKEGTALSAKEFASQVNFYYRSFTAPLINAHAQLKAMFATMAEKAGEFKAGSNMEVGALDVIGQKEDGSVQGITGRIEGPLTDEAITSALRQETSHLYGQIFELWSRYMDLIRANMPVVHPMLQHEREESTKRLWNESIFRETLPFEDCIIPSESMGNKSECAAYKAHTSVAETLRNSEYYQNLDPLLIEDVSPMNSNDTQPIVFEQRYLRMDEAEEGGSPKMPPTASAARDSPHLIVFVHGFMGNSYDLRLMRNHFAVLFPHFDFLMSTSNEESTLDDIEQMGANLAEEVRNHIVSKHLAVSRISFICFSLGGVITRSALTHPSMKPYLPYMYTYLSLSSPHCGMLFSTSFVVDSGMWFMKSWKKSKSLSQLSFSDTEDKRESYIYRLSQMPTLEHFKHVLLLSSMQDKYAPAHSSRVEMTQHVIAAKNADSELYHQMVKGILEPLMNSEGTLLLRIDISFGITKLDLDSAIGRTAHILFLESAPFLRMFVHLYGGYLE